METYRIENLSFTYPGKSYKALDNVNIKITCGDFITICGKQSAEILPTENAGALRLHLENNL